MLGELVVALDGLGGRVIIHHRRLGILQGSVSFGSLGHLGLGTLEGMDDVLLVTTLV
jgi:hypothetical protein